MDLNGMDKTVDKLIMITDKRLRSLRTQEIEDVQTADYYQLLRDSDWYHRVKRAILDARGGTATATAYMFTLLNERMGDQIKAIDDQALDNIRMAGAGTMPDKITGEVDLEGSEMSMDDRAFLRSCGIKTERGETWLP